MIALPRWLLVLGPLAILSSLLLTKNVDFRVYWIGAQSPFAPGHFAYGPESGAGAPMEYRYPPVTYAVFKPLTAIPLYWAGVLWNCGAWAACIVVARKAIATLGLRFSRHSMVLASACLLPYVAIALRAGNVQPYLIAALLGAMLWSESRPVLAATLFAVAITFKIWPIVFAPWFLWRQRRRVLLWVVPILAAIWLAPMLVWNVEFYGLLLRQWHHANVQPLAGVSEQWFFPGQSLRGVMLRYLSPAEPWIAGFPRINVLDLPPSWVAQAWQGIAAVAYLTAFWGMLRSHADRRWQWDGLSFALWTAMQPYCLKSTMISLGPAILFCAAYAERIPPARKLFAAAAFAALLGLIAQYRPLLHLLGALGIDFFASSLLLAALAAIVMQRSI